jgi:hypothetical protein
METRRAVELQLWVQLSVMERISSREAAVSSSEAA